MPLKVNWEGVFPAIPTQFKEDLSIDIEATQKISLINITEPTRHYAIKNAVNCLEKKKEGGRG